MSLRNLIIEGYDVKDNEVVSFLKKDGFKIEKIDSDSREGHGANSNVYRIDKRKVVKVSGQDDPDLARQEVEEYSKLVDKLNRNVARVYYSRFIDEIDKGIIVMENLFNNDYDIIVDEGFIHQYDIYPYDLFLYLMENHIDNPHIKESEIFFLQLAEDFDVNMEDLFVDGMVEDGLKMCDAVLNGMHELRKLGVNYNDIHKNNVMLDKRNNYKIIDFYY